MNGKKLLLLNGRPQQGTLTVGEGSVQLTLLRLLVMKKIFSAKNVAYLNYFVQGRQSY
jgi:hypothetical protein